MLAACSRDTVAGESDLIARYWQEEDGLHDNSVVAVAQAPDGFLWVATTGGLAKFDGVRFQDFPPSRLSGVLNLSILAQQVDHHGRLWLGFDRAVVACLDSHTVRTYKPAEAMPTRSIVDVAEDAGGTIWFAYADGRLSRIRDGKARTVKVDSGASGTGQPRIATDKAGRLWYAKDRRVGLLERRALRGAVTLNDPVQQICGAGSGGIWLCTERQLLRLEEGQSPTEKAMLAPAGSGSAVTCLREDHSGVVWIGTAADGLWRFDGVRLDKAVTSHRAISCLTEDIEGNLWVGTMGGGLNRLRPRTLEMITVPERFHSQPVRSVTEDTGGRLWVVLESGELARQVGTDWEILTAQPSWPGGKVNCVAADARGAVWIGTQERGLGMIQNGKSQFWRKANGLADDAVRTVLVSTKGEVWLGFSGQKKIQRFHDGTFQTFGLPESARAIRGLAEDTTGRIWLGTADGQLLHTQGDQLVDEPVIAEDREHPIRCLLATTNGSVWIGYAGWGIGRVNQGHFTRVTTAEGLHDDYVSQMIIDGQGRIWCAGQRGLFHVDLENLAAVADGREDRVRSFLVHSRNEGVASLQAAFDTVTGAQRGHDGAFYFPMRTGLAVVRPERLRGTTNAPKVLLEAVTVDGETVARYAAGSPLQGATTERGSAKLMDLQTGTGRLELPPGHRKVQFEFTAPSFTAPENVLFRYWLEGFDEGWVEAGSRRSASYPRLPAGRYEFHIVACNDVGIWNERDTALAFTVRPFLWNAWWFRLAALTVCAVGTVTLVRYVSYRRLRERMRQLQQQAVLDRERSRIARDMHDTLGASLTQIGFLGELAKRDGTLSGQSSDYVKRMTEGSKALVQQLDEIVWAVDPENDTLDGLATYISQFVAEFFADAPIRCRMKAPALLPDIRLATDVRHSLFLAVREALNNVARHSGATEAVVDFAAQGDAIVIRVEDNGHGFDVAAATARHGLANLKQRLAEIGGICLVESTVGKGTIVTLTWHGQDEKHLADRLGEAESIRT